MRILKEAISVDALMAGRKLIVRQVEFVFPDLIF